jgi:hypothetical protein
MMIEKLRHNLADGIFASSHGDELIDGILRVICTVWINLDLYRQVVVIWWNAKNWRRCLVPKH